MKKNLRTEAQSFQDKFGQVINQNNNLDKQQRYDLLSEVIDFIKSSTSPFELNKNNYGNAVFLMGPTGSGKSTLINYLADNDLYFKLFNNKPGIFPTNDKSIAFVGKGEGSTTLAPNIWVSDSNNFQNTTFIDCAGEFDSSGIIVDVINEKIKSIIAQNVSHAKILIVSSQNSIGPAGSYGVLFKQGLEKSAQFLNDISYFEDSTAFVISHAGRNKTTPKTVKSYLESVIQNKQLEKYKTTLEKILNQNKFATFSTFSEDIDEDEQYTPPQWNQNQKQLLIDLINNIQFKEIPPNFFNISSSSEVREQMRKAFSLIKEKATNLLHKSVEEAISTKLVLHAIKLKDFVNFVEQDLIAKPQETNLSNYIKFINNRKFIEITPFEEVQKLSEQIDFIWPYTQNVEQQHSHPKINWNSHIKYNLLMKDVLEEAKFIIHDAKQLFSAFCDKVKIKSIGCFEYSENIKCKMDELVNAFICKNQIENNKHTDNYHYNVTESQFDRMNSQAYTEQVPYVVKEKYNEKVVRMVDNPIQILIDTKWIAQNQSQSYVQQGYVATGRENTRPIQFIPIKYEYCKYGTEIQKIPKEFEEEKERDVIKYQTVTKYNQVPVYKNVQVRKFDQKKYDSDILNSNNKISEIKIQISDLLNKANTTNKELKTKIPLNMVEQLILQAKGKSSLDGNDPKYSQFNDLIDSWKSLEYENCILNEYVTEMNLGGDINN